MRVYHERLRVPISWWLVGMTAMLILATETIAGYNWIIALSIYAVLVGGFAAMLVSWGRASVTVADSELRAGGHRLPLADVGEVAPLDAAQTRALRGPQVDPAAYLLLRPYLRTSVYVEVASADGAAPPEGEPAPGGDHQPVPYWLIATRHPAELAAAINSARPATRPDGSRVG